MEFVLQCVICTQREHHIDAQCIAAVLKMRVTNVSHFHYRSCVIQDVSLTKNWKKIPSFFQLFQLMLSSDKAVLNGEQNMGKEGKYGDIKLKI